MNEIPIIIKIIISLIFLLIFAICVFCTWRVFEIQKRIKQVQDDRNKLLEERCSDIMFRTIKRGETVVGELLSTLEKRMILNALNMPEYGKAIQDPKTSFQARKAYRELVEKIKESIKE